MSVWFKVCYFSDYHLFFWFTSSFKKFHWHTENERYSTADHHHRRRRHHLVHPQLALMHPLCTPTQRVSIIAPSETDTDNWSQIFLGRTQRDLLFFPPPPEAAVHFPVSPFVPSPSKNRIPCCHRRRHSSLSVPNTAPFTATVEHRGDTHACFDPDLRPPSQASSRLGALGDICKTFQSAASSL